jgi:hypothetical protein
MPLAACTMLLLLPLLLLLLSSCSCQQLLLQLLQFSLNVQTLHVQVPQQLQAPADLGTSHQADLLLEWLDSTCG